MPAEPRATYRLQLHAGFDFDAAAGIADYLAELGVSHLYCSPCLQAAPGSTHGYDVIDPTRVNDELGGPAGHARLVAALARAGLGQILDIVPNHMAIGPGNRWWWDVLENGPASRYAAYFDLDWDPPEAKLRNTVLLPVLGDHYGRVLEAGEIRLARAGGTITVHCHEHTWPAAPRALEGPLALAAERCGSDELAFLADAFGNLPAATSTDPAALARRDRDKSVLTAQLARLCREHPGIAAALDVVLDELNHNPDALDAFLESQNYRIAFWRTAAQDLGYRRFFDINTLVGIRAEHPEVFEATHARVLEWLHTGVLDGVRIDHLDGLRDPRGYLQRLHAAAPQAWLLAEKILMPGEQLPGDWPLAGTTGYDFAGEVGGLFVDPAGEQPLTDFYAEFTDRAAEFASVAYERKLFVLRHVLGSDLNRLTALLLDICEHRRRVRDYTRQQLHDCLRELLACFPVYRTYIRPREGSISDTDVQYVTAAVESARRRRPDIDSDLLDFVRDVLLLRVRGGLEDELVLRFQQLSGPVMAKGVEDTAFYNYHRLVSLNEVGADPARFGVAPDDFHTWCRTARQRRPLGMLATSTHDTKRSEDVRARLALLSEIPQAWRAAVQSWAAHNARHRAGDWPDRNTEYLLYQTLVGAWPLDEARAANCMEKAAREAKTHTSWTDPQLQYEAALRQFVRAVLADARFGTELATFVRPLIWPGRVNALAQCLVKLTAPGVPDIYQGMELWNLSLVDPDNRRPVDYELRRRLLHEVNDLSPEQILARADDGLPKLWVTRQALHLRRRRPEWFGSAADYTPVPAAGAKTRHVLGFLRAGNSLTLAPRLVLGLGADWNDTTVELPDGRWRNEFTGETRAGGRALVADLLHRFPVALLSRLEDEP